MSPCVQSKAADLHVIHAEEVERRLGEPMLQGNRADVFEQTPEGHKALLGIVGDATNHINLDAAVLHTPGLGARLLSCLVNQFRKGVRVQVLAHATPPGRSCVELAILRDAGATLNEILVPQGMPGWIARRFAAQQRQLVVVDGQVAWCGPGVRTADLCTRGPQVCLRGPIVQRLQRVFLKSWQASVSHPRLPQANFFPPMATSGSLRMGMSLPAFARSAGTEAGCALVGAIESAHLRVFISMAQRVPSRQLMHALSSAANRGVNVSVLLQGNPFQDRQWHRCCIELLRSRAWVLQGDASRPFPPHCTVDGVWSCIALDGGTDWHSARVGGATSLIVLGTEFAEAMEVTCRDTVERALLLDANGVVDRGALHRILRAATGVYGRWGAPTRRAPQVEESSRISRGGAP